MIRYFYLYIVFFFVLSSCASKKEILYLQDIDNYPDGQVLNNNNYLQPNDILKIDVGALIQEAALPFNKLGSSLGTQTDRSLESMKLEFFLKNLFEKGGYLINPSVSVRLLNAKFTILGEVKSPGTFTYTDNNVSLLQALGFAGGLTINADREDVVLIRETDGKWSATHINLTESAWLNGPNQNIQPNDVLVVNPNASKVKSAGYIGDLSGILGVASLILTSIILITN